MEETRNRVVPLESEVQDLVDNLAKCNVEVQEFTKKQSEEDSAKSRHAEASEATDVAKAVKGLVQRLPPSAAAQGAHAVEQIMMPWSRGSPRQRKAGPTSYQPWDTGHQDSREACANMVARGGLTQLFASPKFIEAAT